MGAPGSGLREHVFITYTSLRFGLGLLALAFPLILLFGGMAHHVPVQGQFSAYYYTHLRDVFVGTLCALGAFLYLYKGFTPTENIALNVAGLMAVVVALVPTDPQTSEPVARSATGWVHLIAAILFILSVAFVCVFRASDTLAFVRSGSAYRFYSIAYKLLGVCMIVAPIATAVLTDMFQRHLPPEKQWKTFAIEAAAMWTFSLFWLLKSKELRDSGADREVARRG